MVLISFKIVNNFDKTCFKKRFLLAKININIV